ncbi:MAG: putative FmdB family regulatory protein [Halieaceae bacterium]|jgi:putative FmdB family regulatory protein
MPIYEYQCTDCGELKEALQKISDAPLEICPSCGNATLRKKISAVAFRLKGSGWYETDFKSGNKKNLAGEAGSSDAAAASGGESTKGKEGASSESAAATPGDSAVKKDSKAASADTNAGGSKA